MTPDLTALIAELRALRAAATQGTWYYELTFKNITDQYGELGDHIICICCERKEANWLLAIAAVNALPTLLPALEAAQWEIAHLQRKFEDSQDFGNVIGERCSMLDGMVPKLNAEIVRLQSSNDQLVTQMFNQSSEYKARIAELELQLHDTQRDTAHAIESAQAEGLRRLVEENANLVTHVLAHSARLAELEHERLALSASLLERDREIQAQFHKVLDGDRAIAELIALRGQAIRLGIEIADDVQVIDNLEGQVATLTAERDQLHAVLDIDEQMLADIAAGSVILVPRKLLALLEAEGK